MPEARLPGRILLSISVNRSNPLPSLDLPFYISGIWSRYPQVVGYFGDKLLSCQLNIYSDGQYMLSACICVWQQITASLRHHNRPKGILKVLSSGRCETGAFPSDSDLQITLALGFAGPLWWRPQRTVEPRR